MKNLGITLCLLAGSFSLACSEDDPAQDAAGTGGESSSSGGAGSGGEQAASGGAGSGGEQAASGGAQSGSGGGNGGDPCAQLDEDECGSAADCSPSIGYYTADTSGPGVFGGCYYSGEEAVLCGDALTCATDPTGTCLMFRNTCIPTGWEASPSCSAEGCPDVNANEGGNGGATP